MEQRGAAELVLEYVCKRRQGMHCSVSELKLANGSVCMPRPRGAHSVTRLSYKRQAASYTLQAAS